MPFRHVLLCLFALLLIQMPVRGDDTSFSISSDAGDPIGEGQTISYTPGPWVFYAGVGQLVEYLYFSVGTGPGAIRWNLRVSMPRGGSLAPGRYPVNIGESSAGCSLTVGTPAMDKYWNPTGFIDIAALTVDSQLNILKLAGTFELHDGANAAALRGEFKLHADATTPGINRRPNVEAGAGQRVVLPSPAIQLDGVFSDDGLPLPKNLSAAWKVVSGSGPVAFADAHNPQTTVIFSRGGTYVLGLEASDGSLSRTSEVRFDVIDPAAHHLVRWFDGPWTFPGPTYARQFTRDQYAFSAIRKPNGAVVIEASSVLNRSLWKIEFAGPGGAPLRVGTFPAAFAAPPLPGEASMTDFMLSGIKRGQLTIKELVLDDAGQVLSFWALFAAADSPTPTAQGEVRFNAGPDPALNRPPLVSAGNDQTITRYSAALLTGRADDEGEGLPSQWSVVSGPGTVTFGTTAKGAATASFSEPGAYVLRLSAQEGGLTVSDEVTITQSALETAVFFQDFHADPIRAGFFCSRDYLIEAVFGSTRQLEVTVRSAPFYEPICAASLSAPKHVPLTRGFYPLASSAGIGTTYPALNNGGPGFLFSGPDFLLKKADFEVKEITLGADGKIASLWIVFSTPGSTSGPLGEIRLNAEVPAPLPDVAPVLKVRAPGIIPPGLPVKLGVTLADDFQIDNKALKIHWEQVSGPATAGMDSPALLYPVFQFPVAGLYVLRATLSAGEFSMTKDVEVAVATRTRTFRSNIPDEIGRRLGTFTITLLPSGQFTAQLRAGRELVPFKGKFENGRYFFRETRGKETLTISLTITSDQALISGSIGLNQEFTIPLAARPVISEWLALHGKPSPYAGLHTFAIEPLPEVGIRGWGFGTLKVGDDGQFRAAGVTATGSAWSQGGVMSIDNDLPLFAFPNGGREELVGNLFFVPDPIEGMPLSGDVHWNRVAVRGAKRFPYSFTATTRLTGGPYVPPAADQNALSLQPAPAPAQFFSEELPGVPFAGPLAFAFPATKQGAPIKTPANGFSLQLAPATGLYRGVFRDALGKMRSFRGVLLQPVRLGIGFYLDETSSRNIWLREETDEG